ncbi:unnamed protein product [Spodoptera littoralis]|uniref:Cytochrome b-c1 complex subunit 8 n=1 Tax=Spodoptera littoralis TaxID=7109 RepID=A0A9P0HVV7_SPOLI|nr:unnamed protein product [Spodoptera littoralis]CAH1635158.1 unnamed protein product [Spodoptera littoralis]
MGRHFGDLAVIRGIIYYKLSPHEQKPFATAFAYGIPNFVPRTLSTIWTWLPCFLVGYITFISVEEGYRRSKRKNPMDYMYEVNPAVPEGCPPK